MTACIVALLYNYSLRVHKGFEEFEALERAEGAENLIQDPDSYDINGLCVDKNELWALSISSIAETGTVFSEAEGRVYSGKPIDVYRYFVSLMDGGANLRVLVQSDKFPSSRFIEGYVNGPFPFVNTI
jgi:hypothetical protein